MNKIGVYHAFPGAGRHERVGTVAVDASGVAQLDVTDERVREHLEKLAKGVTGIPGEPTATPADGPRFLEAISDRYASSSRWLITDES